MPVYSNQLPPLKIRRTEDKGGKRDRICIPTLVRYPLGDFRVFELLSQRISSLLGDILMEQHGKKSLQHQLWLAAIYRAK